MAITKTLPSESSRCMILLHQSHASTMIFTEKVWKYFHAHRIEHRLLDWQNAANETCFRIPTEWRREDGELHVQLPPLPDGFLPFSKMAETTLDEQSKGILLIAVCEALAILHQNHFHMGFLDLEMLYFDPERLDILIDVQPYPSGFPFVNHLLDDFPFIYFSPYTRGQHIPRIADFYALGVFIHSMYVGELPQEARKLSEALPPAIRTLCEQCMQTPEIFLFAEEIADRLRDVVEEPIPERVDTVQSSVHWLHPMASPITRQDQETLRDFLRSETDTRQLGLISVDETTRLHIINQHFNEVLEHNFFFTVVCRNLPFATMREAIERTIHSAKLYLPDVTSTLNSLTRKLDFLLKQHYEGAEIVRSLTDWMMSFFREILPMFKFQRFFYYFEGCENFDEDSLRVFILFWHRVQNESTGLHIVLSGAKYPVLLSKEGPPKLEIGGKGAEIYRRLLVSQLGLADSALVSKLTDWMLTHSFEYWYCQTLVEDLIDQGHIQLTRQGWKMTPSFSLDLEQLAPGKLFAKRIEELSPKELDMLRIFSCLPVPIRAKTMFTINGMDMTELLTMLNRFSRLGLLQVLYEDNVFVTKDIATHVLYDLPRDEQKGYFEKALPLQHRYRPNALPPLIELARLAENAKLEYYFLIRYYRELRSVLSLEQRKALCENIRHLQHKLGRTRILCWDRLLYQIYLRLNQYTEAENLAYSLYVRTNQEADRFRWIRILLYTNRINLPAIRQELLEFITLKENALADKVRAAFLLAYVDFFIPLRREGAEMLHNFFVNDFYPQRHQIPTRLFSDMSVSYTILLFTYFPEREEWATCLLAKLESLLEKSTHHDLILELYNSYIFHSNIRISHKYIQRCLETSRRYGFKTKEQISHLNGMEIALFQGDLPSYRYHLERFPTIDEIKRRDLLAGFLMHQLLYALEWDDWELFEEVEQRIVKDGLTDTSFYQWQVFNRYAYYRRHQSVPPAPEWKETNAYSLFVDAIIEADAGNLTQACKVFQESIRTASSRMHTGWAYREMIDLLLKMKSPETEFWLKQFEEYLKRYGYEVLWPDFFRLSAAWSNLQGDLQRPMLYLRRAINGYQMIEKTKWCVALNKELSLAVEPTTVGLESSLSQDPIVRQLLHEREQFLHQSLDLLIIIQLSEQVTESLELATTFQRLTHALFEYFPVTHLGISYDLFHRQEKAYFTASGMMDNQDLIRYQLRTKNEEKYSFTLYQQGKQSITLDIYSEGLPLTKQQHMEHFLSFIKPHIANALLYMEMMIDNLTGFYQRRYFFDKLKSELELSQNYGLDLSLIMLDLDNFRLVNEHGHQEGDRVLREVADIVRSTLRKNDIPGRYGGEEFLLILPKTDGSDAEKLAEQLRAQIEEEFLTGRPYKVTVSVGVSSLELCEASTIDELIRLADDAEIAAKTTGKNKVVVAW